MHSFCTLFDSRYLSRGLALYDSLRSVCDSFTLYIICFDDIVQDALQRLHLDNIVVIALECMEDDKLLSVKAVRTAGEYCWTCTSFSIDYVLKRFNLPEVTYLDADLFFFQDPDILLQEFHESDASVLITEHRYTPEYDQSVTSGIYCVQFMTFKADGRGRNVLDWWKARCLEWCYSRIEDGKFGDQKYLDNWLTMFEGIHSLGHLGGGVAPWNVQQYKISNGPLVNSIPVVFYHFHAMTWYRDKTVDLGTYRLSGDVIKYIYRPYLETINKEFKIIASLGLVPEKHAKIRDWKTPFSVLKRCIKGNYNIITTEQ